MQRDAAVDLLMGRLGRRTNASLKDDIIREMVFVQENLMEGGEFLPWFLITNDDTLVTVADQEYVALPSDFIREWEDGGLFRETGDATAPKKLIERDDYDIITLKHPGTGTPLKYDRDETYMYLRPIPDSVIDLELWYYQKDTSLAGVYGGAGATTENGWLLWASDWLIAETGVIISGQYIKEDPNLTNGFINAAARAKARVHARDTEWREANKQRYMGDGR